MDLPCGACEGRNAGSLSVEGESDEVLKPSASIQRSDHVFTAASESTLVVLINKSCISIHKLL